MRTSCVAIVFALGLVVQCLSAQENEPADEYFRTLFEAKGRLNVTLDPVSGQVSAVSLTVGKEVKWMSFTDAEKKAEAKKLDGQTVIVTGQFVPNVWLELRSMESIERRSYDFGSFQVKTMKAADTKE